MEQRRERRRQRVGPGGDLDRDGDRVVDEQRDGGHLCDSRAEVVPGNHVRAARSGVDHHHFSIGEGDEDEHQQQGERDG